MPRSDVRPNEELAIYLHMQGNAWNPNWASGVDNKVFDEFKRYIAAGRTAEDFYREAEVQLYHLTWFGMDVWKEPYRSAIQSVVRPPATLVDFGCGIGADGLLLTQRGYLVSYADFPGVCTDYLRWRLGWRGMLDPAYDMKRLYTWPCEPVRHDLVYALDVLEHVPDPEALLLEIERWGEYIAVNIMEDGNGCNGQPSLHYRHSRRIIRQFIDSRKQIIHHSQHADNRVDFIIYR